MKRLGLPIAAILGVVLAGLASISLLLDRDALREAVEAQIRAVTGLDLVVNGAIDVTVFPQSRVVFHDVGLKGGGTTDAALNVDTLVANLRLLPLLMQRFQIADVILARPRIRVVRDTDGGSNWTPFINTLTRTLKPGAESPLSFSEIRIQDGSLTYTDAAKNIETVQDINLSLAWPSISRSFAATGQFDWRGARVDGSISVNDFLAALAGERSGLKIRVAAPALKLAFDGAVANKTSLMMDGTLTADSNSLRNALRWFGQAPPGRGGFGRFALKARANLVGPSLALTNVNVELDGNAAEGVMTYSNIGRQTLQATLAAGALDFTPYVSTFRLLATGARDWNRQLFDLSALSATDLDIRLSAAKLTIGSTRLGRTALGANLRNGSLALSVAEAQIFTRRYRRRHQGAVSTGGCRPAKLRQRTVRHRQALRARQSHRRSRRDRFEPVRTGADARRDCHADRARRCHQWLQRRAAFETSGTAATIRRSLPQWPDAVRNSENRGSLQ
jgi:AsmA protein